MGFQCASKRKSLLPLIFLTCQICSIFCFSKQFCFVSAYLKNSGAFHFHQKLCIHFADREGLLTSCKRNCFHVHIFSLSFVLVTVRMYFTYHSACIEKNPIRLFSLV